MRLDICLTKSKLLKGRSGCNPQLRLDQVNICHLFGDGVLNLNARVHLDKYVLAGIWANRVDQELNGSSVLIANFLGKGQRVAEQLLP